jgi:hypothetical protein
MGSAPRYSRITNDFKAPPIFITPGLAWDWSKWDMGVRIFIQQHVDLTVEYSINDVKASQKITNNEFLTTLRIKL